MKIISLPRLPPKGDLADFLESLDGQEPDSIRDIIFSLADAAPEFQSASPPVPPARVTETNPVPPSPVPPDQPAAARSKPMIILPSNVGMTITESATEIYLLIAPAHDLFIRGGAVMRLTADEADILRLDVVRPSAFCSILDKYGQLYVLRADEEGETKLKRTLCALDTADRLLACEKTSLLPRVRGLSARAVLTEIDGVATTLARGYHPACGGLLITGGSPPEDVPLTEAVSALQMLVADFDFATPGDRSRALASFITPALRMGGWLSDNIPADVAEADQSQSGKTYRQKLIFALYGEHPSRIARKDGGVGGMDESIAQALIGGRPFIQIDNVRGKLDSQFLEMMMTAGGIVPARVPHRGEIQIDSRHFLIFLTSNGVETTPDMANRSSIIRNRKRTGFAYRDFPEGDLLAHVEARQPYFLGAVFSVIRAWFAEGKPRTRELRHSFRQWAQTLDWIVQNLLGEAPLLDGHQSAQERVSNPALTWLRHVALAVAEESRLGWQFFASSIAELCADHEIIIPGLHDDSEPSRAKRVGVLLSHAFGKSTDVVSVDSFTVTRTEIDKYVQCEQRNRPMKSYVFERTSNNLSPSSPPAAPSA